jgi:hypothetical protein
MEATRCFCTEETGGKGRYQIGGGESSSGGSKCERQRARATVDSVDLGRYADGGALLLRHYVMKYILQTHYSTVFMMYCCTIIYALHQPERIVCSYIFITIQQVSQNPNYLPMLPATSSIFPTLPQPSAKRHQHSHYTSLLPSHHFPPQHPCKTHLPRDIRQYSISQSASAGPSPA